VSKHEIDIDPANPMTHFREATWDEALERAAGGLTRSRDAHGGGALAGFGSAKGSNEEAYLFQKLVRVGFRTNNVDHCTRLCHASSVAGLLEGVGSGAVSARCQDDAGHQDANRYNFIEDDRPDTKAVRCMTDCKPIGTVPATIADVVAILGRRRSLVMHLTREPPGKVRRL
jgi:hypothetical protein